MARRLAIAVGRQPVEMEGGVRRGGKAGDQRSQKQPNDLSRAPERHARPERGVGIGAPRQPVLIAAIKRQRCRKRHLEARMHDRLRRKQQHADRRNRKRAKGQRRAIQHHANEHDCDHDERALSGNLGA